MEKLMWRMKKFLVLMAMTTTVALMGAGGQGGCDQPLPTTQQIELNLPSEIRHCPYAPKSPGAVASRRQIATYLVKLRDAWSVCHGNVQDIDRLYTAWQQKVAAANKGY
jgi:hypothetical protein